MPLYVYYGDEDYTREQAVHQLRDTVVDPALMQLAYRVFDKPSLATVLEAVGGVSLAFGSQTLIELKDFHLLKEAAGDTGTERQLEELKALLENLEPTKTVLFHSAKIDGKIKFAKWLLKVPAARVQKFEGLKFWETDKAVDFLMRYAREQQISIQPAAAEHLVNTIGLEFRVLANELKKLALYAYERPITLDDLNQLGYHSDNLFQLVNRWILGQDPIANYDDLGTMLLRRHPVELFATIQSYFNNLFRVCWLNNQGAPPDVIAQETGQKPFTVRKNLQQFGRVPMARWLHLKKHLLEMEWKTKSGQLDGQLALETLLGA